MNRLVRAEWLKLRTTRSTSLYVIGALAATALLAAATTATAGQTGNAPLGSAAYLENLLGLSTLPAFVGLLLGLLATAGEYQHRTITQTFLVTPVRGRIVAAKLLALGVAGAVIAMAMIAIALLVVAIPLANAASVELTAAVAATVAGSVLAGALLAAAGVALGALFRSQVAAIVAVALWATLGEGIISVLAPGVARWLPGMAAAALGGGGDGLPAWGAALLLAGYGCAAAAAATLTTVRRDIA
jgi:ABC-2 type transport system permease protein